jgi:hypothetical protein
VNDQKTRRNQNKGSGEKPGCQRILFPAPGPFVLASEVLMAKTEVTYIRIPTQLKDELHAMAKYKGFTLNQIIIHLLSKSVHIEKALSTFKIENYTGDFFVRYSDGFFGPEDVRNIDNVDKEE